MKTYISHQILFESGGNCTLALLFDFSSVLLKPFQLFALIFILQCSKFPGTQSFI